MIDELMQKATGILSDGQSTSMSVLSEIWAWIVANQVNAYFMLGGVVLGYIISKMRKKP